MEAAQPPRGKKTMQSDFMMCMKKRWRCSNLCARPTAEWATLTGRPRQRRGWRRRPWRSVDWPALLPKSCRRLSISMETVSHQTEPELLTRPPTPPSSTNQPTPNATSSGAHSDGFSFPFGLVLPNGEQELSGIGWPTTMKVFTTWHGVGHYETMYCDSGKNL